MLCFVELTNPRQGFRAFSFEERARRNRLDQVVLVAYVVWREGEGSRVLALSQ